MLALLCPHLSGAHRFGRKFYRARRFIITIAQHGALVAADLLECRHEEIQFGIKGAG